MILIIRKKAAQEELQKMAEDFGGDYLKVVVDVEKEILAGGGALHADEEKILLEEGCEQKNLWGGGLDLRTKDIDYNSMINIRPAQSNSSREILSQDIRDEFDKIVKKLLL